MRAFIGCDLPEEIKSELSFTQNQLQKLGIEGKWVRPENFHLTMAFLGSINDKQVKEVKEILAPINQFIKKPIKLQLGEISAFPNVSRSRVVFVDLSGEIDTLKTIAVKIRNELKRKNIWFDEKPFVPHLTLGRFKKPQNLKKVFPKIKIKPAAFWVKEVFFYQSQLMPSGPIYTKL